MEQQEPLKATRHDELVCPVCKYDKLDSTLVLDGEGRAPSPGDVTICMECAAVLTYGDGLRLHATPELTIKNALTEGQRRSIASMQAYVFATAPLQKEIRELRAKLAERERHHPGRSVIRVRQYNDEEHRVYVVDKLAADGGTDPCELMTLDKVEADGAIAALAQAKREQPYTYVMSDGATVTIDRGDGKEITAKASLEHLPLGQLHDFLVSWREREGVLGGSTTLCHHRFVDEAEALGRTLDAIEKRARP